MKKQTSKAHIVFLVLGGIFIVGGIVGIIIGVIREDTLEDTPVIYIMSITAIIAGVVFAIASPAYYSRNKTVNRNFNDPSSICYRTYGGNGNCARFQAYIDKSANSAKNAATNVAGVLGMVFLGVGVFSTGQTMSDVFVSDNELIINSMQKNPRMNDNGFFRVTSDLIAQLKTEVGNKFVNLHFDFNSGIKSFELDIPYSGQDRADAILEVFNRLRNFSVPAASSAPVFE